MFFAEKDQNRIVFFLCSSAGRISCLSVFVYREVLFFFLVVFCYLLTDSS